MHNNDIYDTVQVINDVSAADIAEEILGDMLIDDRDVGTPQPNLGETHGGNEGKHGHGDYTNSKTSKDNHIMSQWSTSQDDSENSEDGSGEDDYPLEEDLPLEDPDTQLYEGLSHRTDEDDDQPNQSTQSFIATNDGDEGEPEEINMSNEQLRVGLAKLRVESSLDLSAISDPATRR